MGEEARIGDPRSPERLAEAMASPVRCIREAGPSAVALGPASGSALWARAAAQPCALAHPTPLATRLEGGPDPWPAMEAPLIRVGVLGPMDPTPAMGASASAIARIREITTGELTVTT